jgi:hypothetical protein
MNPELLLFGVGCLLLVTGLLGGGFELRELKVPQVGRVARVLATVFGGACIVLGLGMTSVEADRGEHTANAVEVAQAAEPEQAPVEFAIRDQLGELQISETITVVVDGRHAGELTIDEAQPESELSISVDEPGRHDYTIAVSSVELAEDGLSFVERERSGQGSIVAESGARFDIRFADGHVTLVES